MSVLIKSQLIAQPYKKCLGSWKLNVSFPQESGDQVHFSRVFRHLLITHRQRHSTERSRNHITWVVPAAFTKD